jgi:hypothetical protein
VATDASLRSKYDVILFPPVGRGGGAAIIAGMPMFGNAIPWKKTDLTPNLGIDETDDIRPGLGWQGMGNLQKFVADGGVLVGVDDTADFAVTYGLTHGVSITRPQRLKVTGSVLRSKVVDGASPIAYGYDDTLSIYAFDGPIFSVSNFARGGRGGGGGDERRRPTGRGTAEDPDQPQGRPPGDPAPEDPRAEPWQAVPVQDEQLRNGVNVIPPAHRPRVVLRYGDNRDLLVSGLLDGGSEIAQRPMVIDVPVGKGHVVLFSNNPVWRGETRGSYFLVLNAILNHDNLNAGRLLDKQ